MSAPQLFVLNYNHSSIILPDVIDRLEAAAAIRC